MSGGAPSPVERAFRLVNDEGRPIRCDLRRPAGPGPFAVVVILHGFKGFKDWGMFPPTARALAGRGLATIAMNASRNGVGHDLESFTELDEFARNTPGREVADVRTVLDAIGTGEIDPALDASRIGLLGHSRGGGVVLLVAGDDPRPRAVVTWASIASFDRHTERARALWRSAGRLEVPNARTGQILWLEASVLDDLEANRAAYDVEAACRRMTAPLLIVHGERDEAVDSREAERILAATSAVPRRLHVVPSTGHTFGAVHPWAGETAAWREAVRVTGDWFVEHLRTAPPSAG